MDGAAVPGVAAIGDAPTKLKPEAWAAWQRALAETKVRNAVLVAKSVAEQRAAIEAGRAPGMKRAQAQALEVAALGAHRALARQWAADHPDAIGRLAETQARATEAAQEQPT